MNNFFRLSLITICLYCPLATNVFAQHSYIPIPKDSAIWINVVEDWHEGAIPPEPHTFSYEIERMDGVDTIVNGKKYYCFYGDWQAGDIPLPPIKSIAAKYGNWIREDTASKKVWYVRTKSSPFTEELLYDFSLNKGDTINDPSSSYFSPQKLSPYKAWVDNIDSVYWSDDTWRYRWHIKSQYGQPNNPARTIQIEGMGYITHFLDDPLLEYQSLVSTTSEVVCFKVGTQWLYKLNNPWNADCDSMILKNVLGVKNVQLADLAKPILFPNPLPATGILHLNSFSNKSTDKCIIEAVNCAGQKVLSAVKKPGSDIDLSFFNLNPGIYFFIVSTEQKQVIYRQKIILQ